MAKQGSPTSPPRQQRARVLPHGSDGADHNGSGHKKATAARASGGHAEPTPQPELVDEPEPELAEPELAEPDDSELDVLLAPDDRAALDADAPEVVDAPLPAEALAPTSASTALAERARRGAGSLVKSDPLTVYMHEIRRYPLLTREEEHRLAVQYAKNRDPVIARRLITANLRLVVKLAHEYKRAYRNLLDLVQEGNLGLLQAVEKYDPYRGVKLSSYAAWWIRAYMLKFILNNWRLVKIGTTQAQRKLFFNLSKEKEKLEHAGFVPTSKLLAERLSVPEQEVQDMQLRLAASETSLDAPIGRDDEGGRTHIETLGADAATRPDVSTESEEFRRLLRSKLEAFEKTLSGREQTLFHERLMAEQPLTLQEVGERYNISRERARQIEARLLGRLKTYLKKELGDAVQVAMGLD
ncbi:MAG: RNA polymerase factor sigma-32 [Polyangia bacterium]